MMKLYVLLLLMIFVGSVLGRAGSILYRKDNNDGKGDNNQIRNKIMHAAAHYVVNIMLELPLLGLLLGPILAVYIHSVRYMPKMSIMRLISSEYLSCSSDVVCCLDKN